MKRFVIALLILLSSTGYAGQVLTTNDIVGTKTRFTVEGGLAHKFKAGEMLSKGDIVCFFSGEAVTKIRINAPDPIGAVYTSGVTNEMIWVVTDGIADVNYIAGSVSGHLARGFVGGDAINLDGYATSEARPTAPFATDKHFYEIGHVLESRTGAGLAKTVLHFN
jgi:hypothetical protein